MPFDLSGWGVRYLGLAGMAGAAALAAFWVYQFSGRRDDPGHPRKVGVIKELVIYPVKAAGGISVQEVRLAAWGPEHPHIQGLKDRHFAVVKVGKETRIMTAREIPRLSLIRPTIQDGCLLLDADGQETIKLTIEELEQSRDQVTAVMNFDGLLLPMEGCDCGDEVADWLNKFLAKENFRLMFLPQSIPKRDILKTEGYVAGFDFLGANIRDRGEIQAALSDAVPLLVVTESSSKDVNRRLDQPVTMRRFRPNIVLGETAGPFVEDKWEKCTIGETEFDNICPTPRCSALCVDPDTGIRGAEPLKTLKTYRQLWKDRENPGIFKESVGFGIYCDVKTGGIVKVGDPVYATLKQCD